MADNLAVINDTHRSALGWGVIIGGAFVAAAVLFLLLAFGTSVGLSVVSPWAGRSAGPATLGLLGAAWFLVCAAGSFWLGGYLAGRMRIGWDDLSAADGRSRDGIHGLVVWAVGILIFVWLGIAAASVAAMSTRTSETMDPGAYVLDSLFRSATVSPAREEHRDEAARILAQSVGKPIPDDDRDYLVLIVAADTGIAAAAAEERVHAAVLSTKEAADAARKGAIGAGFLTVSGLFIAAAAAWGGAIRGGKRQILRALRSA